MRPSSPQPDPATEVALLDPDDATGHRPPPEETSTLSTGSRRAIVFGLAAVAAVIGLVLASRPQSVTVEPVSTTQAYQRLTDETVTGTAAAVTRTPDQSLFIGNAFELIRIDLTNGDTTMYDAGGRPVHASSGWLVLIHPDGRSLRTGRRRVYGPATRWPHLREPRLLRSV